MDLRFGAFLSLALRSGLGRIRKRIVKIDMINQLFSGGKTGWAKHAGELWGEERVGGEKRGLERGLKGDLLDRGRRK